MAGPTFTSLTIPPPAPLPKSQKWKIHRHRHGSRLRAQCRRQTASRYGRLAADYDLDGNLDIVKTNFAGDTPSLYHNLGAANFEDTTFTAGLGKHTQYLGWGCGFLDFDNDGWPDILICNGHVYPEVQQLTTEAVTLSESCSIAISAMAVSKMSRSTQDRASQRLLRLAARFRRLRQRWRHRRRRQLCQRLPATPSLRLHFKNNWIKIRTIGTKSNRSGIGARLRCITHVANETKPHQQIDESAVAAVTFPNDLRVHFGLGSAEKVDLLEIRWPSGQLDALKDLKPTALLRHRRAGITRTEPSSPPNVPDSAAIKILQHPHVRSAVACQIASRFPSREDIPHPIYGLLSCITG